jgi:hypothetical protein
MSPYGFNEHFSDDKKRLSGFHDHLDMLIFLQNAYSCLLPIKNFLVASHQFLGFLCDGYKSFGNYKIGNYM